MSTSQTIITIIEILLISAVIIGILFEPKIALFERRIFKSIKNRFIK